MSENQMSILQAWPRINEDMTEFLSNPYKWLESKLEQVIGQPEGEDIMRRYYELKNLLDILKTVNAVYSPISFDISLSNTLRAKK